MTIKHRLHLMEEALRDRFSNKDQAAWVERFRSENQNGLVLCEDGVSRPWIDWIEWLEKRGMEIKPQMQEVLFSQAVETVKNGEPISKDVKKYLKPYIKALEKELKADSSNDSYRLKIKLIRSAKVIV